MSEGVDIVRTNRSNQHSIVVREKAKEIQKKLLASEIVEGKVYAINASFFVMETTLGRSISIKRNNDMAIKLHEEIRVIFNPKNNEYIYHEGHTYRK